MKLDLWVRLNITLADDNKVNGWIQIYGKHEIEMYRKPFKNLKPIVNDHIEKMNWLTICNRWGETNQGIEINANKIKRYVIKECVQTYDEHEEEAVREWWRNERTKREGQGSMYDCVLSKDFYSKAKSEMLSDVKTQTSLMEFCK